MNKDVKQFAKSKQKAKANYNKYKSTGSKRALSKANFYYAAVDGYGMKLQNPSTTVNVKETNITDSFKSSKQTVYGINRFKAFFKSKKSKTKK